MRQWVVVAISKILWNPFEDFFLKKWDTTPIFIRLFLGFAVLTKLIGAKVCERYMALLVKNLSMFAKPLSVSQIGIYSFPEIAQTEPYDGSVFVLQ